MVIPQPDLQQAFKRANMLSGFIGALLSLWAVILCLLFANAFIWDPRPFSIPNAQFLTAISFLITGVLLLLQRWRKSIIQQTFTPGLLPQPFDGERKHAAFLWIALGVWTFATWVFPGFDALGYFWGVLQAGAVWFLLSKLIH